MPTTRKKKKRASRKTGRKSSDKAKPADAKKAQSASADKSVTKKTTKKKGKKKPMSATGRKKTNRKPGVKPGRKRVASRKKPVNGANTQTNQTIHCTLAPSGSTSIVLPTSTIAEITDYEPPAPLENAPEWLLGQVEWEDWQVPVISYGALVDGEEPESATGRSRIMVLKSLSNTARVPYIGVLVRQIPRLTKLNESDLEVTEQQETSPSVHCTVNISGQPAVVPDLDRLAQLVGHAAYGTVEKGETPAQA